MEQIMRSLNLEDKIIESPKEKMHLILLAKSEITECGGIVLNRLNEMRLKSRKAKCKAALTAKNCIECSGLEGINYGVWRIGWKWYLIRNHESALAKMMKLQLLSDVVLIK